MHVKSLWPHHRTQDGFTIIELMIATAIFGTVMLIIAVGVLRFTHDYYKGLVSTNTQTVTRSIMSDITQSLQFSTLFSPAAPTTTSDGYCIGNVLYSFAPGKQVTPTGSLGAHQTRHGFIKRTGVSQCSSATPSDDVAATSTLTSAQRELLGANMRVSVVEITPVNSTTYRVHVRIIYGDDDLLNPAVTPGTTDFSSHGCSGRPGAQWCAVSDLTTTVNRRL